MKWWQGLLLIVGAIAVFFSLFYLNAKAIREKEEQERQQLTEQVEKETLCKVQQGTMIDGVCYKSEKLERLELKL